MFVHRFTIPALVVYLSLGNFGFGQIMEEADTETVQPEEKTTAEAKTELMPRVSELIIEKTNRFRKKKGLEAVESNPQLTEAAKYFAQYMARTQKYGHTADGQRPSERASEHGYEYCLVSENIAYQYSSAGFEKQELAKRFFQGWKESPGHRKNMLEPAVTETGVAVAQSEETGYYFAVQMFGRPESASIRFEVVNRSGKSVEYKVGERSFPLPPRYSRTHQRCRPSELKISWQEGGEQQTKTVKPDDGETFRIVQQGGEIQIE